MRNAILLGVLAGMLGACSTYKGEWPRLAPSSPADLDMSQASAPGAESGPAAGDPAEEAVSTDAAATLAKLNAAIEQGQSDFAALRQKQAAQRQTLETALDKVDPNQPATWHDAQFELSRYNQIIADLNEQRRTIGQVVADLAALSAARIDIGGPLQNAGQLINQIDAALEDARSYSSFVGAQLAAAETRKQRA